MGGVMDRWLGGWMGASMGKKGGLWEMNEIDIFLLVVVFSFSFFSFRQSFWILVTSGGKQKHANLCFATCLLFFFCCCCLLAFDFDFGRKGADDARYYIDRSVRRYFCMVTQAGVPCVRVCVHLCMFFLVLAHEPVKHAFRFENVPVNAWLLAEGAEESER